MKSIGQDGLADDCVPSPCKKVMMSSPSIEQADEINPFLLNPILDILFKLLPFDDVQIFRLISSTWNKVGFSELSRRPQKPIIFNTVEELEDSDKLGSLVQLQITKFSRVTTIRFFRISPSTYDLLTSPQIDHFLDNFSPKFIKFFGSNNLKDVDKSLFKILLKISPTVQEIQNYTFCNTNFNDQKVIENYVQGITSTKFSNLRKISNNSFNEINQLCFYSLIGQNSPKLCHLDLGWIDELGLGSLEYMKEQFEQTGLMSKLKSLCVLSNVDRDILKIFTEFGQNGLKLIKLKFEQVDCQLIKEIHVPLIASQTDTLKILEISIPPKVNRGLEIVFPFPPQIVKISFPTLQNLTILKIDYFSSFDDYFVPIDFSLQTPKLQEFRICDIKTFLDKNLGQDSSGDSVKSIKIFKDTGDKGRALHFLHKLRFNFDQVFEIFPNLEYLEVFIFNFYPSVPFRSQLRKVVIHCELQDLFIINRELLQDAKKVDLVVKCGKKFDKEENTYKLYLGNLMKKFGGEVENNSPRYKKQYKYYQRFLDQLSENFNSLDSVFFTFIGYKISEDFKEDLRSILPHSAFICSQLTLNDDNQDDYYYVDDSDCDY